MQQQDEIEYNWSIFFGDLIAALCTTTVTVPQTMAYAILASLPPVYGLYSAIVPPVVYALLGTSRHLSICTCVLPVSYYI